MFRRRLRNAETLSEHQTAFFSQDGIKIVGINIIYMFNFFSSNNKKNQEYIIFESREWLVEARSLVARTRASNKRIIERNISYVERLLKSSREMQSYTLEIQDILKMFPESKDVRSWIVKEFVYRVLLEAFEFKVGTLRECLEKNILIQEECNFRKQSPEDIFKYLNLKVSEAYLNKSVSIIQNSLRLYKIPEKIINDISEKLIEYDKKNIDTIKNYINEKTYPNLYRQIQCYHKESLNNQNQVNHIVNDLENEKPDKDNMIKIFISHSSIDKELVSKLVELFRASLNIPSREIRCTSLDGYRLPGGANFNDQLRQEV
ncbi:toll/interleukin-1 receptor domain-containing protein [Nostoc sp. PCC 7524]|uniref:toll/interleukin-1 receptor domain-containing protein n=1 Tax=Nostoc sp. (strain ATCC 29411 / PCC 7524) TaxID=28072 RepID=UPI0005A1BEFD|nr:toll/interleukin-1 receptor domain-containing protein [Nostoc sp. PCC 7524]